MSRAQIQSKKVVILSGAGISAPSGIPTFRDEDGLWKRHSIEDVATADAWVRRPRMVLEFYNELRAQVAECVPNAAHRALACLERRFEVVVITQNVDDLHERAGSTNVIHLHGELRKARSTLDPALVYDIGNHPIRFGDLCASGSQLRPHLVWFGEEVHNYPAARAHLETAGRVVVVGTSLVVRPASRLIRHARFAASKYIIDLQIRKRPYGFQFLGGSADLVLPQLVQKWLEEDAQSVL